MCTSTCICRQTLETRRESAAVGAVILHAFTAVHLQLPWCAEAVSSSNLEVSNLEVWHATLEGGRHAVALLNRSPKPEPTSALWADLGLERSTKLSVRDVRASQELGSFSGKLTRTVAAYGVVLLVLR